MRVNTPSVDSSYKKRRYTIPRVIFVGMLSVTYRYLITNYELSNFSVCQAKFEEGLPEQIVAIPSANPPIEPQQSARIRQHTILGASVGTAACVLVLVFILILAMRKVRDKRSRENQSETTGSLKLFNGMNISNPVHEIDNNSLYWGCKEISDTGKVELLDEKWPSGSGNNIQEMPPHSPAPVVHELMTSHISPGTSMLQDHNPFNRSAVLGSKWLSGEYCTRLNTSEDFRHIETAVSSSAEQIPSRGTPQNLEQSLPSQSQDFPSNLERSLSTPPMSESPQVPPARTSFSSQFTIEDYLHALSDRTSAPVSSSGDIQPLPDSLIARATEVHGGRERSYLELSSIELEIVIPPGVPGPLTSSLTLSSHGGRRTALANFF